MNYLYPLSHYRTHTSMLTHTCSDSLYLTLRPPLRLKQTSGIPEQICLVTISDFAGGPGLLVRHLVKSEGLKVFECPLLASTGLGNKQKNHTLLQRRSQTTKSLSYITLSVPIHNGNSHFPEPKFFR